MKHRESILGAGRICLLALLLIGCGSEPSSNSNSNNNNTGAACEVHSDCLDHEICDPASSTCVDNVCGDGVMRDSEACDEGADNGVSPSTCLVDCTENTCGDGYLGGDEQCDGAEFDGATCDTVAGLPSGELICSAACVPEGGGCYDCGDGELDGPEACDGANLDGATCGGSGYDGGTMACQADCLALDESACTGCGDGVCDLVNGERTGNCPADCGWVDIDVGGGSMYDVTHACGVKGDGSVWCWGVNDYGQLGNGTFDSTSLPMKVVLLEDAVSVSVGGAHTCALKQDQTVWCWGHNLHGQLGDGTFMDRTIPTAVINSRPVLELDASPWNATCAVVDDATRLQGICWGTGRLGVVTTASSPFPLSIEPSFERISAGFTHSCAIHDTDNTAYCWGDNPTGQLGTGDIVNTVFPALVAPPASIDASQVEPGVAHTCALITDGTVACWGNNTHGVLGNNSVWETHVPVAVGGLSGTSIVQLSVESYTQCALGSDQLVYCWGLNWLGQLGDGTTDPRTNYNAVPVTALTGAVYVDAGHANGCAITSDGQAYCWGDNDDGQLGIGPAAVGTVVPTPTQVFDPYE